MTSAVGSVQVREYLEKQYQELAGKEAIKLAIKALTETVEAGSKNMEVSLPRVGDGIRLNMLFSPQWTLLKLPGTCKALNVPAAAIDCMACQLLRSCSAVHALGSAC